MNTQKNNDYYALDDIGFIGDPDYKWTEEDTAIVSRCIAEHKKMKAENKEKCRQNKESVLA